MGPVLFLLAFLILAMWIGFAGGKRLEIWRAGALWQWRQACLFKCGCAMRLFLAMVSDWKPKVHIPFFLRRVVDCGLGNATLAGGKRYWLLVGRPS